jgi:hypothetical protein
MKKMNYPSGNFGSEFYAGDAQTIGRACARGEWDVLRSGAFSSRHVVFPPCVYTLDILLLPEAISDVTGKLQPSLTENGKCVAEGGAWTANVVPREFVFSVASVDLRSAPQLRKRWKEIHVREYEPDPELVEADWMHESMLRACQEFISLALKAVEDSLDVVGIWKA